MGPKSRKHSSTSDDSTMVKLMEILKDETFVANFAEQIADVVVAQKLNVRLENMERETAALTTKIRTLEEKVETLEAETDRREQYTRRPNLRISGIPETTNEVTNDLVVTTIKKLGFDNIGVSDLERSHRIVRKTDNRGRPRRRTIIVRSLTDAVRDDVYRSRTKLKNHNQHHRDEQVYINEDLTSKRASLAYKARSLKKENKINDCWTYTGKVFVKTNAGMIKEIQSAKDFDIY